jgi:hypothetical protein
MASTRKRKTWKPTFIELLTSNMRIEYAEENPWCCKTYHYFWLPISFVVVQTASVHWDLESGAPFYWILCLWTTDLYLQFRPSGDVQCCIPFVVACNFDILLQILGQLCHFKLAHKNMGQSSSDLCLVMVYSPYWYTSQLTCSPIRSSPTTRNEIPWKRRK